MRSLLPLATALFASCPASQPALVGCAKDVDCKGARICEHGSCVDPPARPLVTDGDAGSPVASPPDGAVQQTDAALQQLANPVPSVTPPGAAPMFHGDWAHTGRSRFRAPTSQPKLIARASTSGTVYSSPAITDEGVAIFGSHDRAVRAVALDEKKPHGVD